MLESVRRGLGPKLSSGMALAFSHALRQGVSHVIKVREGPMGR